MRRRLIASVNCGSTAHFCGAIPTEPSPPTPEDLQRELEVLRGKLRTLALAQDRIERSAQELSAAIDRLCQPASAVKFN